METLILNPVVGQQVMMLSNYKLEDFFQSDEIVTISKITRKGKRVQLFPGATIVLEEDAYYIDIAGLEDHYFYRSAFWFPLRRKDDSK